MIGAHLHGAVHRRSVGTPGIGRARPAGSNDTRLVDMPMVQDVFNPMAELLMGGRGKGKSLALDALGDVMKQRYAAHGFKHCKVYANFPTVDADLADPMLVDRLTDWSDYSITDGVALCDEIQGSASSAKWNSNVNFDLVQALTQIRKKRMEIAFTTQYPRGIEKGLLEQVDYFIECRKLGDGFGIAFAIHDWKDLLTDVPRRHRPFPPFWWEADWFWVWFGTKRYFGHYPTFGQQIPRYLKDRFEGLARAEWQRLGYGDFLKPIEENDDLEAWAQTAGAGRITLPRAAVVDMSDWRAVLGSTKEFSVWGMHNRLRSVLPTHAQTLAGFKQLLRQEGFRLDDDGMGYAP